MRVCMWAMKYVFLRNAVSRASYRRIPGRLRAGANNRRVTSKSAPVFPPNFDERVCINTAEITSARDKMSTGFSSIPQRLSLYSDFAIEPTTSTLCIVVVRFPAFTYVSFHFIFIKQSLLNEYNRMTRGRNMISLFLFSFLLAPLVFVFLPLCHSMIKKW